MSIVKTLSFNFGKHYLGIKLKQYDHFVIVSVNAKENWRGHIILLHACKIILKLAEHRPKSIYKRSMF